MRSLFHISIVAGGFVTLLCLLPVQLHGQNLLELFPDRKKEWKRMSTDQDSTTDVAVKSLVLEPNGVFRATFRIQLAKAEKAVEKPGAKYKTRRMTMQFDSRKNTYRVFEITLLDSSKKVVYTSGQLVDAPWKPGRGGSFYAAASSLPPFGFWRVLSSSAPATIESTTHVTTQLDRFQVGRTTCSVPYYESASMSRDELARLTGLTTNEIQMSPEMVDVVRINCDSSHLTSEVHFLILTSIDRAILLSGGTLFSLKINQ